MLKKLLWAVLFISCSDQSSHLQVQIYDACNSSALSNTDEIELHISDGEGQLLAATVFDAVKQNTGDLTDIPKVENAVISLVGRKKSSSVAAFSTGYVNLNESKNLSVFMGKTDTFVNTSNPGVNPSACTTLSTERALHSANTLNDGRVFIAGGEIRGARILNTTEIYNTLEGDFIAGPNLRWARKNHASAVLKDGRVLISGGSGASEGRSVVWRVAEVFDPKTNAFTDVPLTQLERRKDHTATVLKEGRILLAGGQNEVTALDTTEILDVESGISVTGPRLQKARALHAAVLINDFTVALIGGQAGNQVLDSIEFIDLKNMQSTLGPKLNTARALPVAALHNSTLIVAGGFNKALNNDVLLNEGSAALDFIALDQTTLTRSLNTCPATLKEARGGLSLAVLPEGIVFVGGVDAAGKVLSSAELLTVHDINRCAFTLNSTLGALSKARAFAVATPLLGGDVLMTGGIADAATSLKDTEIYIRKR